MVTDNCCTLSLYTQSINLINEAVWLRVRVCSCVRALEYCQFHPYCLNLTKERLLQMWGVRRDRDGFPDQGSSFRGLTVDSKNTLGEGSRRISTPETSGIPPSTGVAKICFKLGPYRSCYAALQSVVKVLLSVHLHWPVPPTCISVCLMFARGKLVMDLSGGKAGAKKSSVKVGVMENSGTRVGELLLFGAKQLERCLRRK